MEPVVKHNAHCIISIRKTAIRMLLSSLQVGKPKRHKGPRRRHYRQKAMQRNEKKPDWSWAFRTCSKVVRTAQRGKQLCNLFLNIIIKRPFWELVGVDYSGIWRHSRPKRAREWIFIIIILIKNNQWSRCSSYTVTTPAVRAAIKTELYYQSDTIIVFLLRS